MSFKFSMTHLGGFCNLQKTNGPLTWNSSDENGDQGQAMKRILQTLNMCDFCTHERKSCGAEPVLSKDVTLNNGSQLDPQEAIIACDKYASPVELLKTKFH